MLPGVLFAAILLEAESFATPGGWVVDQQFMDVMGSPYMLAHGLGRPVADAVSTLPSGSSVAGSRLWVRTRDWVAPHGPGRFTVRVMDGADVLWESGELGVGDPEWRWVDAGVVGDAASAATAVALHDLTGFEGRVDALFFASAGERPPETHDGRCRLLGLPEGPVDAGEYDFVVAGGGFAGICAAVSAARDGLRVALVQDRPVLGGNASSEVRVSPEGTMGSGPFPRLRDLVDELRGMSRPKGTGASRFRYEADDEAVLRWAGAETNLTLYLSTRVVGAEKDGARICAVLAREVKTGRDLRLSGKFFADCTGDAILARAAGAEVRDAPETFEETGEDLARRPGKTGGGYEASNFCKAVWTDEPSDFPSCPWATRVDSAADARLSGAADTMDGRFALATGWDWGTGFYEDCIRDGEKLRDRNFLAAYGVWDYLKNKQSNRRRYSRSRLEWMGYVLGKRAAGRIVGDHVLCEQDLVEQRPHPDGTFAATWHIDLHFPDPGQRSRIPGGEFRAFSQRPGRMGPPDYHGVHKWYSPYPVPFRCLYSRNVPNLFAAGKDISATYVAMGAIRVMNTGGEMGVVVGRAAALCVERGCMPRELANERFVELARRLSEIRTARVDVDFADETGPVKDVHSVGQPPISGWSGTNMFHYLREAGVRYSRLHDVGGKFGGNIYVDIPNVFRDFGADENDPKSYDFAFTDVLLRGLVDSGVEPFYRLGVTIENDSAIRAYRIFPPKDYAKWARICEHVIRHYTEGWADGYRYKMTYWEIWNEPDLFQDPAADVPWRRCTMWQAPFEAYVRFYGAVAPYLKSKFPHLRFGGFAGCGFQIATKPAGHPRIPEYCTRNEHARMFLKAVKDNGWPLDFFSYHSYDTAANIARQIEWAQGLLDELGLGDTEMILDEWLCRDYKVGSGQQAAETAATLAAMQNSPLSKAMIYDAKCGLGAYSPLFDPATRGPRKAYFALKRFNDLKRLGTAVRARSSDPCIFAAAAKGAEEGAVYLANVSCQPVKVRLGALKPYDCRLTDETHDDASVPWLGEMPPKSFVRLFVEQ